MNEIIAPEIKGFSVMDQSLIDQLMIDIDGTENKSRLGANGVSADIGIPLYRYVCWWNKCSYYACSYDEYRAPIYFQEFMIVICE